MSDQARLVDKKITELRFDSKDYLKGGFHMKSRLSLAKIVAIASLSVALFAVSCTPETTNINGNANTANRNGGATPSSTASPADAVAASVQGFYQAGPTGNVSLRFAAPTDGQSMDADSVAPTFTITGYPIYKDGE